MASPRRALFLAVPILLLVGALVVLPKVVADRMNRLDDSQAIPVSTRAAALHATLRVADLHDDLLLWDRAILPRGSSGHTDVARLAAGRVAVQVFSTVTKTPKNQNYDSNSDATDNITLMALASRWPPRTYGSLLARALHQAAKLERAAARSEGALVVVRSRAELAATLDRTWALPATGDGASHEGPRPVIGLLSTEGLHAIEGRLEYLDTLHAHGFRMAGLAHFFDNEVAGSAHGVAKGGLSELGRQVVRRMEALGMIVDLAHSSRAAFDDALALASRPVVVSHTGVQAVCGGPRNLSDAQLRALARNGALVGIGFWDGAICSRAPRAVAASIAHAVRIVGIDHVALGSDWDGATTVAIAGDGVAQVTQALLDIGFTDAQVRAVMGENLIRFLLANLTDRETPTAARPLPMVAPL